MSEYPDEGRWLPAASGHALVPEVSTMKRRRLKSPSREVKTDSSQPWREVRPEVVARARKLIRQKGYPTPVVLDSVAELLAKKLKRPQ